MSSFEAAYVVGEELGKGAYATVYKCTRKADKSVWAVKMVDKTKAAPKDISDVMHEVNMMKTVGHHPNVVQLIEFFDTPSTMYLVLEMLQGGMLFDRIVQMKHYSEASASRLVKNFLLAMQHIHAKGIIHRDLKPENLLLKHAFDPAKKDDVASLTDFCVADFGLSGKSPGQTCCGSPSYIAPEVINVGYLRTVREPYDTKCDIWSVGVIAYILISGKMPFHGRNFKETFAKIVKNQWSFLGDVWEKSVSSTARDFIKYLLTPDPKKRPSAAEALNHKWLVDVQSDTHVDAMITGLKQFNAERKLRGAMMAFRATTSFLGKLDQTPPFMKYLTHENKMSTVIQSASQTDKNKVHHVDFSRALLCGQPGWRMQDCCTCGSNMVCRHTQNVHEYLFVGRPDMDVFPFIHELQAMHDEAQFDFADDPMNKAMHQRAAECAEIIKAAEKFREMFMKVPKAELKSNFMLEGAKKPGVNSEAAANKAMGMFKKKL